MKIEPEYNLLALLGAVIRRRRQYLGLSQEELAAKAGLNRSYIGDIERGTRNLALLNISRLASALEMKPSQLIILAEKRGDRKGSR